MRLSLLQKLENAHEDSVWTVQWGAGSNCLVTGSVDETAKIWAQEEDILVQQHVFTDISLGAVSIAVDSKGSAGAICSLDSNILLWNMADNTFLAHAKQNPSEAWGIAFMPRASPEEPLVLAIAGGSSNKVRLWDVTKSEEILSADMPANEAKSKKERFVLCIAVASDGSKFAAGAMDGAVAVFDAKTGHVLRQLTGHFKPVRGISFTPDSKHVLTACDDCHVNMYDVQGGALVDSFSGHENWVVSVAVHPDGTAFVTGGADGKVKLWDMATKTCVQTLNEHVDQVWGVAWRADGSRVASVSDDRSVCIFDFA